MKNPYDYELMAAKLDAAQDAMEHTSMGNEVILINGANLTPLPVRWLWSGWLAKGKLHILAGAPGQGKTTIALNMAATVTIGGRWPDGSRCEPGNVLIWSGEDDPADTLLPRLMAAGADVSKCYFVSGTHINGESQPFDPARDMTALERQASLIGGFRLLMVDPVVSVVMGDSHKNAEVRRSLQPLVDLGSRLDAAVLGITHFSKGGAGSDPAQRVIGSVAFTAVARIVMVAAKTQSKDGEDCRILARGKSNNGPDDGGFEYHIEQTEPLPGIQASYIAWGDAVTGTARELLAETEESENDISSDELVEMMQTELTADCWTPAKDVFKSLADAGFSKDQVKRAAKRVGVIRQKSGMTGGWYWRLPGSTGGREFTEESTKGAKSAPIKDALPSHPSALPSSNPSDEIEDAEVF
ncbi:MAG: AAA family ATPase [Burkholderiaceae bacterium]